MADPSSASEIRSVVITTDFSACGRSAVDYGSALAKRLGARVTILHALSFDALISGPLPIDGTKLAKTTRAALEAEAVRVAETYQVEAKGVLLTGPAPALIFGSVGHLGGDLMVVGTAGVEDAIGLKSSGARRRISGGIAESVLRHSALPVLTVHAA